MNHRFRAAVLVCLAAAAIAADDPPRAAPQAELTPEITAEQVTTRVAFLASDALEGRESGTKFGTQTEDWVAAEFRRFGLEPLSASKDSPFTDVPLAGRADRERSWIEIAAPGAEPQRLGAEMGSLAFSFSKAGEAEGGLVFAGYGITAPDQGYDDYEGVDVKGKVVLVLRHGPAEKAETSPWRNPMRRAREVAFAAKAQRAAEAGAAALLVVNDTNHPADEVLPVDGPGQPSPIPVFAVSRATADVLLAPTGRNLVKIQAAIDGDRRPRSAAIENVRVKAHATMSATTARNVVFVRRGSDEKLAGEAVLVCAHMDHVGRGTFGSASNAAGRIHNGADDNASGTAALLEVAEALAAGPATKRTLVFAAWCAEEKGLIGSRFFAEHPLWDLSKIVCCLNMDMVGRYRDAGADDEGLIAEGTPTASGTAEAIVRLAGAEKLRCTIDSWESWEQSDHFSFYNRGVPSLFLHTGLHADYHRPEDDWWKVNGEGEARIARVVAGLARELADADARPAFAKKPPRPVIGVRLADAQNGGGARLLEVFPGLGANAAGLVQGDVVVGFRGERIATAAALSRLIQASKPGDVVEVVFLRGSEEKKVKVSVSGM